MKKLILSLLAIFALSFVTSAQVIIPGDLIEEFPAEGSVKGSFYFDGAAYNYDGDYAQISAPDYQTFTGRMRKKVNGNVVANYYIKVKVYRGINGLAYHAEFLNNNSFMHDPTFVQKFVGTLDMGYIILPPDPVE
ncbi:hypothetical protein [Aureivirga marina]|uniref:hypothetical protein n=1 Tax=Aureivirga marina TaxID=1182451 RepID=UPI0018C93D9F|nr:hypothetical protein [Aureivirga marina]